MSDYAHNETDKRIADLENRLSEEYRQAYKETKDKLEKYLNDFKRKDESKRQEVANGTLSAADYATWRRNQMLVGQRWTNMVDTLAKDMSNTNRIAAQIVNGDLPEAFALNANYASYQIENGYRQNYGFTLYDRDTVERLVSENPDLLPEPSVDIPADERWNKQKITSNITQAILQGKSIPEIAKTMETVVGMNKASAVRNARTAMTGAQNAGRQQAYERAAAMGIKLQKEWVATLDGRTRHSHGAADGQKVDINGVFSVGGCKMRYPGDVQNGTAAEIYNCRCTMVTVEPPEIMQGEEPRMTYSEWVQTKEGQEATGGRNGKSGGSHTSSGGEAATVDVPTPAVTGTGKVYTEEKITKPLDNGGGRGIIEIGKSLGASAKNYPVKLPDSNKHVKLAEGQTIVGKAFAGKGTKVEIKDRFKLESKFNIPANEWKKMSGKGKIIEDGKEVLVELHWYEADGGVYEMKVKRYLDES